MALKGSVSVEATPNGHDLLVFTWEAVQDAVAKTSTISWVLQLVADASGALNVTNAEIYPWAVTIDGQAFSGKSNIYIQANQTKTLATGSAVLSHDADGTKSFEFSFMQNFGGLAWGSTETRLCPKCGGEGLDDDGKTCSMCNGKGIINAGDTIYINDVTGSGVGVLDSFAKKFPLKEWITGIILERLSRTSRTPVAYLYNGVRLPALPEWDREAYPFATIFYNDVQKLYALNMTTQGILFKDGKWSHGYTGYYESCTMDEGETDWGKIVKYGASGSSGSVVWSTEVVWTNYDLYDTDGNLYMTKSNPVPVYE